MIEAFTYLIMLLSGTFVVWKFGKDLDYKEEKLIDSVLISTGVAFLLARVSYLLTPIGQDSFINLLKTVPWWLVIASFFQLNAGNIWWIGICGYLATSVYLIWKWNWNYWPMIGVAVIGLSVASFLYGIQLIVLQGLSFYRVLMITAGLLIILALVYLIKLGGDAKFVSLFKKFSK